MDGGFAEYCAAPVSQVYKVADSLSFEQAAMTEPVSCCLHGIELCNIKCGATVMVIGCGMIGLIMLQLAKAFGCCKYYSDRAYKGKEGTGFKTWCGHGA